jgi:hypothetical protein
VELFACQHCQAAAPEGRWQAGAVGIPTYPLPVWVPGGTTLISHTAVAQGIGCRAAQLQKFPKSTRN